MTRLTAFLLGLLAPGVLVSSAPLSPLHAQATPPTATLVADALARADRGDTTGALAVLATATDQSPRDPDALYWRGRLLVRTMSLGLGDVANQVLAWRLLERGSSLRPNDARYVLEMGRLRLKTPLLRADAERLLRRAHTQALANAQPEIAAEAAWEMGLVRERRYRTTWHRRVYTSALFFDQYAARSRLHYVREFLEHQSQPVENAGLVERSEAEEWYRRGLAAEPRHAPNAVGLMGLLYDEQRYDEMLSVSAPLRAVNSPHATVWFASGLAAWRLGDGPAADSMFERALSLVPGTERRSMEHIGHLLRTADSTKLAQLDSATFAATTRAFWDAANPLRALPVNAARLEYLARIAVSTLRYDDVETGTRGWRTDRGQIVLRYGEPPVTALFPSTDNLAARDAAGRVVSVFYYPRTELSFVFSGANAINLAGFAGDFRDFADAARDDAPFRLDDLPLAMQVDTLEVQIARFQGRTTAEAEVVVAGHLDPARWYRGTPLDSGDLQVTLYRGAPDALTPIDSQHVTVGTRGRAARTWVSVPRLGVGDFRLRLEAWDPEVQTASARAHVRVPITVNPSAFSLSDILLGSGGRGATANLKDRTSSGIVPSGRTVVHPLDTFALYWEAYGTEPTKEDAFDVSVRVTVRLLEIVRQGDAVSRWLANLADKVGLTPEGDDRLSVTYSRREPRAGRDRLPMVLRLGLGEAPTGRYRLEVQMTDVSTGRNATTVREFQVRPRTPADAPTTNDGV